MNISHYLLWVSVFFVSSSQIYSITFLENRKLLKAARKNDSAKLTKALNAGAEINHLEDKSKQTALIMAAKIGGFNIVKSLLGRGANYRIIDNERKSALTYGAINGNGNTVTSLLENCDQNILDHTDSYNRTALHWALYKNNYEAAKLILKKNPELSTMDTSENLAIFIAISKDRQDLIETMLANGYEVNLQQPLKYNVSYQEWSAHRGMMIEKKETRRTSAYSALMHANISESNVKIVQTLVEHGANMDLQDRFGYTALMHSSSTCQIEKVKYLVEQGSSLTITNFKDENALSVAIKNGCTDVQLYLKSLTSSEKDSQQDAEETDLSSSRKREKKPSTPISRSYDF
jgi:ankyrin repeat protein